MYASSNWIICIQIKLYNSDSRWLIFHARYLVDTLHVCRSSAAILPFTGVDPATDERGQCVR